MILKAPCCITSRLLPGVRLGDAEISIAYAKRPGRDGRTRYEWRVDLPGIEEVGDDLQSGCNGGSLRDGLESLLHFLSAFGEGVNYASRSGRESEDVSLFGFPPRLAEWAAQNTDELSLLAQKVNETPDCIEE